MVRTITFREAATKKSKNTTKSKQVKSSKKAKSPNRITMNEANPGPSGLCKTNASEKREISHSSSEDESAKRCFLWLVDL